MSAYQTVVVGTDGSESSLRAVDRAGAIAADHGAKLIVATAHLPVPEEKGRYAIPPGSTHGADYRLVGEAPFYAILRDARERARKAGAKDVEEKSIVGAPSWLRKSVPTCWSSAMSDSAASPGGCWDQSHPKSPARPRPTC
jgi:nucleotide-binding universal stress UspA family protein